MNRCAKLKGGWQVGDVSLRDPRRPRRWVFTIDLPVSHCILTDMGHCKPPVSPSAEQFMMSGELRCKHLKRGWTSGQSRVTNRTILNGNITATRS
jgi:hypothetical protein